MTTWQECKDQKEYFYYLYKTKLWEINLSLNKKKKKSGVKGTSVFIFSEQSIKNASMQRNGYHEEWRLTLAKPKLVNCLLHWSNQVTQTACLNDYKQNLTQQMKTSWASNTQCDGWWWLSAPNKGLSKLTWVIAASNFVLIGCINLIFLMSFYRK